MKPVVPLLFFATTGDRSPGPFLLHKELPPCADLLQSELLKKCLCLQSFFFSRLPNELSLAPDKTLSLFPFFKPRFPLTYVGFPHLSVSGCDEPSVDVRSPLTKSKCPFSPQCEGRPISRPILAKIVPAFSILRSKSGSSRLPRNQHPFFHRAAHAKAPSTCRTPSHISDPRVFPFSSVPTDGALGDAFFLQRRVEARSFFLFWFL